MWQSPAFRRWLCAGLHLSASCYAFCFLFCRPVPKFQHRWRDVDLGPPKGVAAKSATIGAEPIRNFRETHGGHDSAST